MTREIDPVLLEKAIMASHDGIVVTDATREDNPIIYVNPAFERLTGYTAGEVLNRNCRFLQGEEHNQPELETLRRALKNGEPCLVKLKNFRKNGTRFWNELSISPVPDAAGRITHFIGVQKDITTRVEALEQLRRKKEELEEMNRRLLYACERDTITGLFSRRYFDERAEKLLASTLQDADAAALIFIDIDHFKRHNDTFGRKAGNDCLRRVGKEIQHVFNAVVDLPARFSGGKFVVFSLRTDQEATQIKCKALQQKIGELAISRTPDTRNEHLTVSIGFTSVAKNTGVSMDRLLSDAENTLAAAKKQGESQILSSAIQE